MADSERVRPEPVFFSGVFVLAFALSVVMRVTDTNLQTDFGTRSSGYYVHWYVILGTAVADLIGVALLLLLRSRTAVKLCTLGSVLLVVVFLRSDLYLQPGRLRVGVRFRQLPLRDDLLWWRYPISLRCAPRGLHRDLPRGRRRASDVPREGRDHGTDEEQGNRTALRQFLSR